MTAHKIFKTESGRFGRFFVFSCLLLLPLGIWRVVAQGTSRGIGSRLPKSIPIFQVMG
ncbi:hypothetical protein F3P66_01135 [Agrobacterium fabrum]|uniref:Uncharacterized protein n=1 Tax=Agrobacterium fabrum (strain C58 / ATCC 33970) TaxID=176299 RepID=Q8UC78_AGRFC|nr:hypothetical protein Atu2620 [Agrobacterium fabrum str. C58]QKW97869.1 hypothetical protein GSF67_12730 [Agrobacterium sp. CGMCC 11546]QRM58187.1 hypothetical protein F3P66_01135 [Agrobacterium fabrum]TRB27610.1 hypothetical protein EXN51_17325 [Agrobacterium fabrum]